MTDALLSAFEAAARVCPPEDRWVQIGASRILIRIAGPRLADILFHPLRHIERAAPDASLPDITINAWSIAETGIPSPPNEPLEWSDPQRSRIVASFPGADELTRLSLARPFQVALVRLLAEFNLPAVHGGLIAAPNCSNGILLIGPNGSGKSTTCLSAVQSGFRLVGEDCLALERNENGFLGHSMYCSLSLTQHSQRMFASLPGPLRLPHGAAADAKAVLMLPPVGLASPMAGTLPIKAIIFPEITGLGDSRFVTIPTAEAYRRLMPGLRLMRHLDPENRQRHHDAIAALVTELPCFRIELGSVEQLSGPMQQFAAAFR
jgi:hypothetical protein